MINFYKILIFIHLSLIVFLANGQSTCATAITLTPGTAQCGTNSYAGSFPDDGSAPVNLCDSYYNDGEYWFKFVGTGKPLKLDVSGLTATYSGIYVLSACPSSSPTCIASYSNGSSTANYSVTTPILTNGVTYYIVIANWSSPYSTAFCLNSAEIPVYTMSTGTITSCNGIFQDPEGTGNYADHNNSMTMTFCSGSSDALKFVFTEFETKEAADNLKIYDGPNILSPLIGTYSQTTSPGTITSSGSCLTFVWTTDNNQDGTVGWTANFSCVPPPPANNECINATSLTVNSDLNCGTVTHGTVQNATASSQTNPCGGTADDDVWYKFVATSTAHQVSLLNLTGSTTDMYFGVYSGSCGSLTNLLCSDPETNMVTGLTIGNTYYVRVYTYTSTPGQTSQFDICIGTPPPPPANDECSNATALTINTSYTCAVVTHGTTQSATASSQTNPCSGTADDDVWYYFTATNDTLDISLLNITGSTTDMYFIVYSGNNCSSLTNILCSDPNSARLTGLTVGSKYYVRVYTYYSGSSYYASFDICVSNPPPPPPNNDCSNATALVVNTEPNCPITTSGYTANATASSQTNPCYGTADDDVWYYFTATNDTIDISLLNITGTTTDMYFSVYSGNNCSSLTNIACSDPDYIRLTGLTVGSKYYVRVYTYSSGSSYYASFDICVSEPLPLSGALCSSSLPFCSDSTYNFPAGVNNGDAESGPDYCCLGSQPNPVWYYLRVNQPGDIELDIHSNPQRDLDFICWGPFTNIDDPCINPTTYLTNNGSSCNNHHASGPGGGYPSGNTVDCSYDASYQEWCYIPNA